MLDASPPPFPDQIPWLRYFPWIRLFGCPGAAADPKRLFLASLALLALQLGWSGVDKLMPSPEGDVASGVVWHDWRFASKPYHTFGEAVEYASSRIIEPVRVLLAPIVTAFDPDTDSRSFSRAVLNGLWMTVVMGVFAGAITRIAAVALVKSERVGLIEALTFTAGKAGTLIGAPLIPVMGVLVIGSLIAAFGLLYRIPGEIGPGLAGLLHFLPLIGGLQLTLVVIGLVAGWPMMIASVATEGEDGFDAISRSFAYVYQRPWQYLSYGALAVAIGCVGFLFVDQFARLVCLFSGWALSFTAPAGVLAALYNLGPSEPKSTAVLAHLLWLRGIVLLVQGWLFSYLLTVAAAIYLLLRRSVDGTPWSEINHTSRPNPFDSTPDSEGSPGIPGPHEAPVLEPSEVSEV
jgi:hypothetical protein